MNDTELVGVYYICTKCLYRCVCVYIRFVYSKALRGV